MEEGQEEPKANKRRTIVIIAVVAAIIVAFLIPILLLRGNDEGPAPLEVAQGKITTLENKVTALEGKVATLEGKVATQAESIADLPATDWTAVITLLQAQVAGILPWSGNFTALEEAIADIKDELSACNCTG
jgi:hypothetical protein